FHMRGRGTDWTRVQLHDAPAPVFLEGPSFDREGNLWVVDIPWGRIFRIDPKGAVELAVQYDGEPNGLKFHPDGRAFIADYRRGLARCPVAFGAVWLFSPRGEPLYRIDSPDGIYTTNCAYGGSDGRTLYMLESRSGTVFTARVPVAGRAMYSHHKGDKQ